MAYDLAAIEAKIDTVQIGLVTKCTIDSLLGEEDVTADDDEAITRTWTIKDGNCTLEFLYDPTPDAGQQDVQDDYDTPATSEYVITKGTRVYTFDAFPKKISDPSGPKDNQRITVDLSVTGGIATS
jgi:hypothetical protein